MRLPHRKPGKYTHRTYDPLLTADKLRALQKKLTDLKEKRKFYMEEVSRLAELGDFSENVEYQLAKRELRRINSAITVLEHRINTAEVITPKDTDTVEVGHSVTVDTGERLQTYQILGSSEIDLARGIISYTSPIGSALLGKRVGDTALISLPKKILSYKIMSIE